MSRAPETAIPIWDKKVDDLNERELRENARLVDQRVKAMKELGLTAQFLHKEGGIAPASYYLTENGEILIEQEGYGEHPQTNIGFLRIPTTRKAARLWAELGYNDLYRRLSRRAAQHIP